MLRLPRLPPRRLPGKRNGPIPLAFRHDDFPVSATVRKPLKFLSRFPSRFSHPRSSPFAKMGTNDSGFRTGMAIGEVDGFEVFSGDLECFSTEDLVFFLESSFRKSEFEKVAAILSSQEKSLKAEIGRMRAAGGGIPDAKYKSLDAQVEAVVTERCLELEDKSKNGEMGLRRRVSELEQKLLDERDRSAWLEAKEAEKLIACEELEKSKRNCARLEEQLIRFKEDLGVVQGRERRLLDRIDVLSSELEKKGEERRKEFVELKAANGDLKYGKRRAEDERDE